MLIKSDVFKISERLKKIDSSYYVVFNGLLQRFEVHSSMQKPSLCFVAGECLDKRVLDYAQKSQVKNSQKIIEEIEEFNLKLETETNNKLNQSAILDLTSKMQFLEQKSTFYDFCSISNK